MKIEELSCPKCSGALPVDTQQGKVVSCPNCGSSVVWPYNQESVMLTYGMNLCPNCGVDNENERSNCKNCGNELIKTCPECKQTFYIGDSYCPKGHDFSEAIAIMAAAERSKSIVEELENAADGATQFYYAYIKANAVKPVSVKKRGKQIERASINELEETLKHIQNSNRLSRRGSKSLSFCEDVISIRKELSDKLKSLKENKAKVN